MATVVITGSSSGFGLGTAEALAASGHTVYATMRDSQGRNREVANTRRERAKEKGWKLVVVEMDVTSSSSVEDAARKVEEDGRIPDVVINNAGQMFVGFTEAYTDVELARQLDVNLVGLHRVTRAFLPAMRKAGSGLFINLSSIAGRFGAPFFGIYHASKWGVEGYSLGLRREVACTGVEVVVVEPGPFTTNLFPGMVGPDDGEGRAGTYPELAHNTLETLGAAFEEMFADPEAPTDPQLVVDRICGLVEMPAGTRPVRSVVGVDLGVRDRNASDETHDRNFLEMMGLTDFARVPGASAEPTRQQSVHR